MKRILIPGDNTPYFDSALHYACDLSKWTQANIECLVVLDIPDIEKKIGPTPAGGLYWADLAEKSMISDIENHISAITDRFAKFCSERHAAFTILEEQGKPSDQIIQDSPFYDLIVMGLRTSFIYNEKKLIKDITEKTLHNSQSPVLAVTDQYKPIQKIIIIFEESLYISPVIKAFVQWFDPMGTMIDLVFASKNTSASGYNLNQTEKYLQLNGFKNINKIPTSQHTIDFLEENGLETWDLVVTDKHTHHYLKSILEGSVVQYVINSAKTALFVA